jgi:hypothetical protein
MAPVADPAWAKHTVGLSKEEEKAGMMVTVKGWTCRYCSKNFWNKNLKRLLAHLCGDRDAGLSSGAAELCSEETLPISDETKAEYKAKLTVKDKTATAKRQRAAESSGAEAAADKERAAQVQSRMKSKTVETCEVDGALSDFFDGLGIGHSKVGHPLTKRFAQALMNAPPDYKLPARSKLSGTLLDQQHQVNVDERNTSLKHEGTRKFGLAGTTDGATIQKTPLLNFLFMCVVFPVALLLKCHDCTSYLATGASKDAEYITTLMIMIIRSLPHPRYVDLIITDGAGDMSKFRRLLSAVFPWINTLWCVSHICNCVLKRAASGNDKIEGIIEKGKAIVDRFGGSKHFEHSLFITKSNNVALIRYCDTRFGLYFLMLHRLLVLRKVLKTCVSSDEYQAVYGKDGAEEDDVYEIIEDSSFWHDVELLVRIVWPLMMLLRLGDMRKPTLHLVYKAALLVQERLDKYNDGDDVLAAEYASALSAALERYLPELTTDLAMAASLGDTNSWATDTLKNIPACKIKFTAYLKSFVEQYEESGDFETKASDSLLVYLNKEGISGRRRSRRTR